MKSSVQIRQNILTHFLLLPKLKYSKFWSTFMKVKKIGIIGAGQMGRGIAQVSSQSGFETLLFDLNEEILQDSKNRISAQLQKDLSKGKTSEEAITKAKSLLQTTTDLKKMHDMGLIIEAATENKSIKFKIFKDLSEICSPKTILASNTSSISITEIAAQTKNPTQVVGMHFMNPVPVMKLVEGISGLETSPEVFKAVEEVAIAMGKTFVKVRDIPGFAVNRVLMPMINEAIFALYEGISTKEDLDTAMKLGTNVPMGPLELADFIGLDTCLSIMEVLHEGLGDSKYRPCPLLKQYVAASRLGRKNKRGFYDYP